MQLLKTRGIFLILLMAFAGCRKYAEGPATIGGSPAYLRVFNVVPFTLTPINSSGDVPFFTFLLDPQTDKSGTPSGGYIVCDWLGTRQAFSTSISINEGNSLGASLDTSIKTYINYEYPGAAHVLTAPTINGYDLSAWAQVPSGKHRVVFISRPKTDTPFNNLSTAIRNHISIDTTIDLQPGEVYTLQAVAVDEDHNRYGAYLRQEQFIHQAFSDSNLYVAFFNLSGIPSAYASNQGAPTYPDFQDSMQVNCTYNILDDISYQASLSNPYGRAYNYYPLPGFNKAPLTILTQRMNTTSTYYPLPLLPDYYYFDPQGLLRLYPSQTLTSSTPGTLPWVSFYFTNTGSGGGLPVHELDCEVNPALANILPVAHNFTILRTYLGMASLSLFSNATGSIKAHPCLNILDLSYNSVYCMQIQPATYKLPN